MRTDYHCHVLPGIDDGAKDVEMSVHMLEMLHNQGVERVIATPHFYAHKEKSVARFLEKRRRSYEQLMSHEFSVKELILGAEVALEHGISELEGIEQLAISGTNLILLELPYSSYAHWMSEEIYNISCEHNLTPVIAHVHRCIEYYSKSELENILKTDALFQINNEAFMSFRERRFVKNMMKEEYSLIFGSDSHNLSARKPNFDVLTNKVKPERIKLSDEMLDKFTTPISVFPVE